MESFVAKVREHLARFDGWSPREDEPFLRIQVKSHRSKTPGLYATIDTEGRLSDTEV